jgi:hypothetical protein
MKKLVTLGLLVALASCSAKPEVEMVYYVPVNGVGMVVCKVPGKGSQLRDCMVNGFAIESVDNPVNVMKAPADLGQE